MSIYSNDNIRKIAKLTTRELPQKSKNAEITVRENNGLYSTQILGPNPFPAGVWSKMALFSPKNVRPLREHFHISHSSFVSIISEFSHMFGQALAQWRAFSLAVARSSRLHSFSRSGHLSRCCMVCSEVPHSQAVHLSWKLELGLKFQVSGREVYLCD